MYSVSSTFPMRGCCLWLLLALLCATTTTTIHAYTSSIPYDGQNLHLNSQYKSQYHQLHYKDNDNVDERHHFIPQRKSLHHHYSPGIMVLPSSNNESNNYNNNLRHKRQYEPTMMMMKTQHQPQDDIQKKNSNFDDNDEFSQTTTTTTTDSSTTNTDSEESKQYSFISWLFQITQLYILSMMGNFIWLIPFMAYYGKHHMKWFLLTFVFIFGMVCLHNQTITTTFNHNDIFDVRIPMAMELSSFYLVQNFVSFANPLNIFYSNNNNNNAIWIHFIWEIVRATLSWLLALGVLFNTFNRSSSSSSQQDDMSDDNINFDLEEPLIENNNNDLKSKSNNSSDDDDAPSTMKPSPFFTCVLTLLGSFYNFYYLTTFLLYQQQQQQQHSSVLRPVLQVGVSAIIACGLVVGLALLLVAMFRRWMMMWFVVPLHTIIAAFALSLTVSAVWFSLCMGKGPTTMML